MRKGLTLIELILVVGILTIIAAMTAPFANSMLSKTYEVSATDTIVSAIRKAQYYSMNKKGGSIWGICKTGAVIRIYRGTCANPTQKEDTEISSSTTVTGLNTTTFSAIRGEPSTALSVTINSSGAVTTITLNLAGGITIN